MIDVWNRNGTLIALSNRTLAWYSRAGIVDVPVLYRQPDPDEVDRLSEVPICLGESLPSMNIAITTKQWRFGCGRTEGTTYGYDLIGRLETITDAKTHTVRAQNRIQGRALQAFDDNCGLPNGTQFAVIPIPVDAVQTTWTCGGRR